LADRLPHQGSIIVLTPEKKRQNLRLALVLVSVALTLLAGFVAKAAFFGI
jgi:hypothetical protein